MMTSTEILKKQNQIALNEFKRNYNKGEMERVAIEEVFGKDSEVVEFEKELQSQIKGNYQVSVSNNGLITIMERVGENTWVLKKTLTPSVRLPYAYEMGRKVSKKAMLEVINQY